MELQRATVHVRVNLLFPELPSPCLLIPFRCLGHVVNLANIDVMRHITNIAAVENKTAIWEFDLALPRNRIANGGLDIIATLRTLAIKVSVIQMALVFITDIY